MADNQPTCFISYSWDSKAHQDWVRETLGESLVRNGIDVRLDRWDTHLGMDLSLYMESSIRESDFVLLVCTPQYAAKANERSGGVGTETTVVTGEFFDQSARRKFVPLLRDGDARSSIPSYLGKVFYVDLRPASDFSLGLEELLRHLFSTPQYTRPPVGPAPAFVISESKARSGKSRTTVRQSPDDGNSKFFASLDREISEVQSHRRRTAPIRFSFPMSISQHSAIENIGRYDRDLSNLQDRRLAALEARQTVRDQVDIYLKEQNISLEELSRRVGVEISARTLRRFMDGHLLIGDRAFAGLQSFIARVAK